MCKIKMDYIDTRVSSDPQEVVVYDFLHVSPNESYALCWATKLKYWMTVPVHMLTPRLKKELNES